MTFSALLTDRYEISMLATALKAGTHRAPAVFEAFARKFPGERGYGIAVGIGPLIETISQLRFDDTEINQLVDAGVLNPDDADDVAVIDYLRAYRFNGTIAGLPEGEEYFPGTPVLTVVGEYGEALLLETLILSTLNHASAVGAAAVEMVAHANGAPLIEMGSRRIHPYAAVDAARAAYVCGFSTTSNLAAGARYGVPTGGTAAHAQTLAFGDERTAFRAQVERHGVTTTLLVDTYDTRQGIENAVAVAREYGVTGPDAVRIDSALFVHTLAEWRKLLDDLGASDTKIVASGDINATSIRTYAEEGQRRGRLLVDTYGVGSKVVTGDGHPNVGFVYKLVEHVDADGTVRRPEKNAAGKGSVGGRKYVWRDAEVTREVHTLTPHAPAPDLAPATVVYIADGVLVRGDDLEGARARNAAVRDRLSAVFAARPLATWHIGRPRIYPSLHKPATMSAEPTSPAAPAGEQVGA